MLTYKTLLIISIYEGVDFGVRCFTPPLQSHWIKLSIRINVLSRIYS
nr:MAG TPA: hypothetical protein [Caudoviricetes sp.]